MKNIMKRFLRRHGRILLIVSAIFFLVTTVAYSEHRNYKEQISEKIVEIPIGAYTFAFPRNAYNYVTVTKDFPRRSLISLEFLLPGMEPKTAENASKFSPRNTLTINISAFDYKKDFSDHRSTDDIDTSFNYDIKNIVNHIFSETLPDLKTLKYPPLGSGEQVGNLLYYKNKVEGRVASDDVYTNDGEPIYFLLKCADESWANPMCNFQTFKILGHIGLYYRYPRNFIGQAEEIHKFAIDYLKSHFKGVTDHG